MLLDNKIDYSAVGDLPGTGVKTVLDFIRKYTSLDSGRKGDLDIVTGFFTIAGLDLLYKLNEAYSAHPHGACWVKPLKQERLTCQADFDRWAGYVEAGNWEGFMLRKDVPYQSGRTKDLLKVKRFFDDEYVVEGVETGKMSTALPGQGNVEYEGVTRLLISHKGFRVGVGSGMSREQRIAWMNDPTQIVGKTVTIKYFEESKDQNGKFSLRFPTLKVVHGAERDT